jgi:phosphoketolase
LIACPRLVACAHLRQLIRDGLVEHQRDIAEDGDDVPTTRDWKWNLNPRFNH